MLKIRLFYIWVFNGCIQFLWKIKISLQNKHNFISVFCKLHRWRHLSYQIIKNAVSLKLIFFLLTLIGNLDVIFVSKYRTWKKDLERRKAGSLLWRETYLTVVNTREGHLRRMPAALRLLKPIRSPWFSFFVACIRNQMESFFPSSHNHTIMA